MFVELKVPGAWVHIPEIHGDERGTFEEQFKFSIIEKQLGIEFLVKQVNKSVSNKGVLRGIHVTDSERGQAKYISCSAGSLWDFVVDLRPDSPTFLTWDGVMISPENSKSVLISEGIGHAFLSLEDGTVATYLCTSEYDPKSERTLNPLQKKFAEAFLNAGGAVGLTEFFLSDKDRNGQIL